MKLYSSGQPSEFYSLILEGTVKVTREIKTKGTENVLSRWESLGLESLEKELKGGGEFIPDFDAVATTNCRILRISRMDLREILELQKKD